MEDERCQAGAGTQAGWEHTGEGVVPHVEGLQAYEAADAWRYLAGESVGAQVQRLQVREVSDGRRDGAGYPVERQAQRHHPRRPPAVARHALPCADAGAAVPGGEHAGAVVAEPCPEGEQRCFVVVDDGGARCGDHQDGDEGR